MSLSLVFNIVVAIIIAEILKEIWKANQRRNKGYSDTERASDRANFVTLANMTAAELEEEERDGWMYLWSSVPENVRRQARRLVEADRLRRRAKKLDMPFLWPFLWKGAPEEARGELRNRWEESRVRQKPITSSTLPGGSK